VKIAVHWFRADLRLRDNTALCAADAWADAVVPVFIFDPLILKAPDTGAHIVGFMLKCLRSLEHDIAAAGGKLILRHGPVEEEMRSLWRETGATALYFNRDYEPQARKRDASMQKLAESLGLEVHSFKDGVIHEPDEVLKEDGDPYRVFTPYARSWRLRPRTRVLPAVKFRRPEGFKEPSSKALPTAKELGFAVEIPLPPAGEEAARNRLKEFAGGDVLTYASGRDFPARNATSRLSPHLRLGTLSPRTVLAVTEKAAEADPAGKKDAAIFESELIWREFYRQILWHYPHVAETSFKEDYAGLKWENNERLFAAWCEGRTGFPIVDAGMRQFNTTGWMHNRVRMIVSSFLTKDLLVSWQWGERYFMQKLMDADLASNNGGWQWSASTGTDAQPYFRIFNPMAQAERFDPEGRYIHHYIPEVDSRDYPKPIVEHREQRVKALALFKR
jgi:deoxyribodipyrimidine photo-lyase